MKTIEFKIYPNRTQRIQIEEWLSKLRGIWNIVLGGLEEFDSFTGTYLKEEKTYAPCCPIRWQYKKYYLDEDGSLITYV